jgi:hypothetical protein
LCPSYFCRNGTATSIKNSKEKVENKSTILFLLLTGAICSALLTIALNTAYADIPEKRSGSTEIPVAYCIYDGKEYKMKPYIYNKDHQRDTISYPDLPDRISPQMLIQRGETVTMKFDEKPKHVTAYLIDYDADKTETYSLKKKGHSTFIIEPTGIKTLEVHATFSDHRNISYTILADVPKSNPIDE